MLISLLLSTRGSIFRLLTPSCLDSIGLAGEFENPVGISRCAGSEEHVEKHIMFVCVCVLRTFSCSCCITVTAQSTACVAAHTFPLIITHFQIALTSKEMPWTSFCLHKQTPRLVRNANTQNTCTQMNWLECVRVCVRVQDRKRELGKKLILCKNRL